MTQTLALLTQYLKENYSPNDRLYVQNPSQFAKRGKIQKKAPIQNLDISTTYQKKKGPPKAETKAAPKQKSVALKLEKPKQTIGLDTMRYAGIYQKIAPHVPLHKVPPKDSIAVSVKNSYKDHSALSTIPIFVSPLVKDHATFLTNMAKAIDAELAPSRLIDITEIEQQNRWPQLLTHEEPKFIIIPQSLLFQSKNLLTNYREVGQTLLKKLGEIPTLVLKDIDVFYRSPAAKQSLWKILQEEVAKVYER